MLGKGNAELRLPRVDFVAGDVIEGSLMVTLAKAVRVRGVRVMLYAERLETRRTARGSHTSMVRVYDHVIELQGAGEHAPGTQQYAFRVQTPHDVSEPSGPLDPGHGILQRLLTRESPTMWYLRGFLDVPLGLDVAATRQITLVPRAP